MGFLKVCLALLLIALVDGQSPPARNFEAPVEPVHQNPVVRRAIDPDDLDLPLPYNFQYTVSDVDSGAQFRRTERSDGSVVTGEYNISLPDGRQQIVRYTADDNTGFHVEVEYAGEPRYPEPNFSNRPPPRASTPPPPPTDAFPPQQANDFSPPSPSRPPPPPPSPRFVPRQQPPPPPPPRQPPPANSFPSTNNFPPSNNFPPPPSPPRIAHNKSPVPPPPPPPPSGGFPPIPIGAIPLGAIPLGLSPRGRGN